MAAVKHTKGPREVHANAKLMAAAPAMADAIEMALSGYGVIFEDAAIEQALRDALALARTEKPAP